MSFTILSDNPVMRVTELVNLQATAWMNDGACVGHDPALFFDVPTLDLPDRLERFCSQCPVQQECLDYAVAHPTETQYGLWGGMPGRTLHRMIRDGIDPTDIQLPTAHGFYDPRPCQWCGEPLGETIHTARKIHERCLRAWNTHKQRNRRHQIKQGKDNQ